jgi:hypothetical protein
LTTVLVCCLVTLFPLGLYCILLARLNQRPYPIFVPGLLDAAALLFALAGVLLFVGPGLLTGFSFRLRDVWLMVHYRGLKGLGDPAWRAWMFMWYLYFAVVGIGSLILLWSRRRVTSVYNVALADLDEALAEVLDRNDLDWTRAGKLVQIRPRHAPPQPVSEPLLTRVGDGDHYEPVVADGRDMPARANGLGLALSGLDKEPRPSRTLVRLDEFAAMRHTTLIWSADAGALRQAVESDLDRTLRARSSVQNPIGPCFMAMAAAIFSSLFILTVVIRYLQLRAGML